MPPSDVRLRLSNIIQQLSDLYRNSQIFLSELLNQILQFSISYNATLKPLYRHFQTVISQLWILYTTTLKPVYRNSQTYIVYNATFKPLVYCYAQTFVHQFSVLLQLSNCYTLTFKPLYTDSQICILQLSNCYIATFNLLYRESQTVVTTTLKPLLYRNPQTIVVLQPSNLCYSATLKVSNHCYTLTLKPLLYHSPLTRGVRLIISNSDGKIVLNYLRLHWILIPEKD